MIAWPPHLKEKQFLHVREYGKGIAVFLALFIAAGAVIVIVKSAETSKLEVSFLDVGQGDAVLVRTPSGYDILIDGGPSDAILSRLDKRMSYFDRNIDVVIATHDDTDHVTGLIPVLKKYDVEHVMRSPLRGETGLASELSSKMEEERSVIRTGERGDVIDFGDGVMMYVLYPTKNLSPRTDTNDASVAVVLVYGEHSFLLTGDLSTRYESRLLGGRLPRHVTVYKAGHHGSKTSSGEQLLAYIKPEYAIISASKDNRYGHPNMETLERLSRYAKETLSTTNRGTITFESDGRTLNVETEK